MKSVQKNFRTGEVEDQTPEPTGWDEGGMMNVLRQAFNAGWVARPSESWCHLLEQGVQEASFRAWLKDVS